MKEELLSTCEKTFPLLAIFENLRLDGRNFDEYRNIDICFGKEWGSCQVSFGETKVMAQVTCDVQQPKATRPNEGLLFINTELSPMGAVHFDATSQSDLNVYLNRLLEKCIKESRCVDLESLCIVAEEKVWNVRVDLVVLNYDGNLIGCCSVAALSALSHFRRPDVTTTGEDVIIHSAAEKDPIPLSLHHLPVAIQFAIFNKGDDTRVIVDPTGLEEKSSQAELVLAVNTYRELCGLHLAGLALTDSQLLLQYVHKASKHAVVLVDRIKQELAKDADARLESHVTGLLESIKIDRILGSSQDRHAFNIHSNKMFDPKLKKQYEKKKETADSDSDVIMLSDNEVEEITSKFKGSADLQAVIKQKQWEPTGGNSSWAVESSETDDEDDVEVVKTITLEDRVVDKIELSGDSEEEEVVILNANVINEGRN